MTTKVRVTTEPPRLEACHPAWKRATPPSKGGELARIDQKRHMTLRSFETASEEQKKGVEQKIEKQITCFLNFVQSCQL